MMKKLRMISVREPWASEIAKGIKTVELRTYAISRGPLGIASTATSRGQGRLMCIVDVVEILKPGHPWLVSQGVPKKYYGMVLDHRRQGRAHVPVAGKLGIWYLDVSGDWAELI